MIIAEAIGLGLVVSLLFTEAVGFAAHPQKPRGRAPRSQAPSRTAPRLEDDGRNGILFGSAVCGTPARVG